MNIQAFAGPLKKNGSELKSIVGTFQARRSAPPAALPGQPAGYGMQQMPQGYAAPQLPTSMAPAAPNVCPIIDLLEDTGSRRMRSLSTLLRWSRRLHVTLCTHWPAACVRR